MKKLLYISFLFLAVGCNGQDKNTSPVIKEKQEEKTATTGSIVLNINNPNVTENWKGAEKFSNQNLISNKIREEEFVVGDTIIQHKTNSDFMEIKFVWGSPFRIEKTFDRKTLYIKHEVSYFYDVARIYKKYDAGKLVEEIDIDTKYPISINDIIKIVKEKYNIDLNKPESVKSNSSFSKLNVRRYLTNDFKPQYFVKFPINENAVRTFRGITIDGETGEILLDKNYNMKE